MTADQPRNKMNKQESDPRIQHLLNQLEDSIENGEFGQAAIVSRELALHKVKFKLNPTNKTQASAAKSKHLVK